MAKLNSGTRIYGNVTIDTFATATGNITGGNVLTGGLISATGAVTGASLVGTITTAAQTNITSVGNLTTLTISTANVAGTSLEVYNVSSNTTAQLGLHATSGAINRQSKIKFYGTFSNTPGDVGERYVTSIRSGFGNTSTAWGSEFLGVYVNNTTNDTGSDANQTLIASFTNNNVNVYGNIVNGGSNGVGNIGSSTTYFNTVFAKATSAQYADVAEKYTADADYPVGTVLRIGGIHEVSQTNSYHATNIVGTVSDKPAYVMNSGLAAEHVAIVALLGRVPCRVTGKSAKVTYWYPARYPELLLH